MKYLFFLAFQFTCILGYAQVGEIETESWGGFAFEIIAMEQLPGGDFLLAERSGIIHHINKDGDYSNEALDLTDQVQGTSSERGLLGLTIHPDFSGNGYIYLNHTNGDGDTRIARYSKASDDPLTFNADSREEILGFDQPYPNHNGGDVKFGPDGMLYIATGDGGSAGDPENRAQNLQSFLGKMLRIDVDSGDPYAIPSGNPFVGQADVLHEIWSYGLRNPWRFSFDSETEEMWIADVGQSAYEEVDVEAPLDGGNNYGWRCWEGNEPYNMDPPCDGGVTSPYYTYEHGFGLCSITGGYVYRGEEELCDGYFYADYCSSSFFLISNPLNADEPLRAYQINNSNYVSYTEDSEGRIYGLLSSGSIHLLTPQCDPDLVPDYDLERENLCTSGDTITLAVDMPPNTFTVLYMNDTPIRFNESGFFDITETGEYQVQYQGICKSQKTEVIEIGLIDLPLDLTFEDPLLIATEGYDHYQFHDEFGNLLQSSEDNTYAPDSSGTYFVTATTTEGCMRTVGLEVIISSLYENSTSLRLYPNPTTEKIYMEYENAEQIEKVLIYDLYGRMVEKISMEGSILDISHLTNGVYALAIETEKGRILKRIIKK